MSLEEKIIHTKLNNENFEKVRESDFSEEDLRFISSLSAAVIQKSTKQSQTLVWIFLLFVVAFVSWTSIATVDEVTRASGKIIPSHQIQKVQYLEGGTVTEILIREGDFVKKGQPLIKIDSTGFTTKFQENKIKLSELRAKGARLKAQIKGKNISFEAQIKKEFPDIVREETSLFKSSVAQLQHKIDILKEQLKQRESEIKEAKNRRGELARRYELISKEIKLTKPLVDKRLVSEVEFLKLKRQASEIEGDLDASKLSIPRLQSKINEAKKSIKEARLGFSNKAKKEYNEVISEIARIEQTEALLKGKVYKAVLRSPVDGTVKQLLANTVGGVVHPGRDVLEIVPLEDSLIAEVNIRPSDIAYLHNDQEAIVKFSAYDFSIYGGLHGKIIHISADTITNEKGESYYLVRVVTEKSFLGIAGKPLKIMAGMTVTVDILTGKKTILDYIMKPILKAKHNALRER